MHAIFRLPLLSAAALLFAEPLFAIAESPMPDPIAPAVIGRPLDQLGALKNVRPKAIPSKPAPAKRVAAKPAAAKPLAVAPQHAAVTTATLGAAAAVAAPAPASTAPREAKQAVDDRADPNTRLSEVGEGKRLARKPLGEGAYIAARHRNAVHKYYEQHPVMRPAVKWKIGEPVPRDAVAALVPRGVLAVLPPAPPGHTYVELGGEVVLVATGSRMVVDGVSRTRTETAQLTR
ncbi:hypothetical protein [Ramlibacter pallidus]|uniref:DUF1236 domain-containing protein n=1 Tax=Ramlibacter pallidus TaxID=2780087 RepID=A0ABR9S0X7_9BURK|nr:hypothetical protein [Ramlibacter pallidus]MBE7367163.1 hypothetical protein [Ramlibacter pallidus]